MSIADETCSTKQAAEALGVTAQTIRNMILDGRLKAKRKGYHSRVLKSSLDDLKAAEYA